MGLRPLTALLPIVVRGVALHRRQHVGLGIHCEGPAPSALARAAGSHPPRVDLVERNSLEDGASLAPIHHRVTCVSVPGHHRGVRVSV